MTRPELTLVGPDNLPVYPIPTDLRLTGHYFTKFWHDRWLYSKLRLTARPDVRWAALDLFWLAQKQAPVGTLPDDDGQLASLLLLEIDDWRILRGRVPGPLYKWHRCLSDTGEVRLMHPVVLEVAEEALARRVHKAQTAAAWSRRKQLERLRRQIVDAGGSGRQAADEALVERLDAWLDANCSGNRTLDWVRRALEADATR